MDLEYFKEVGKGALGASLYFTGAYETTDVEEFENDILFSAYPNPVTNVLNIQITNSNKKQLLRIMNQQGQTIISQEINMETRIDFSDLPNGLYFLVLETEEGEQLVRKVNKIS